MSRFDSVVVGNDLVSEHWLAEQFPATVKAQRTAWKDREDHGKTTPRSGLLALGTHLATQLVRFREQGDVDKLREWHASVRAALGFSGDETVWSVERGGQEVAVPTVVVSSPTGTHLLVVQARDARSVEDLLDVGDGGAGHLLAPAVVAGVEHTGTAKAVSEIFAAEEPPALVLVTAGGWLLLAERGSWPEGRWLAVDLATALERRDARAGGELETIAALVSADSLTPADDGTTPFLTLLDDSVKHAVGVSKDLRDGVRESIELLASRCSGGGRARGLPSDADGLAADLTRQSLRYLYRILFLLYAEARPELGVLPVGAPEYAEGYGLDRLRELALDRPHQRRRPRPHPPVPVARRCCSGWSTTATRPRRSGRTASRSRPGRRRRAAVRGAARRPLLPERHRADRRGRPRRRLPAGRAGAAAADQEAAGQGAAASSPTPSSGSTSSAPSTRG